MYERIVLPCDKIFHPLLDQNVYSVVTSRIKKFIMLQQFSGLCLKLF